MSNRKKSRTNHLKNCLIAIKANALCLFIKRENLICYLLSAVFALPFFIIYACAQLIFGILRQLCTIPLFLVIFFIPLFLLALISRITEEIFNIPFKLKLKSKASSLWPYHSTQEIKNYLKRIDEKAEKMRNKFSERWITTFEKKRLDRELKNIKSKFDIPPGYEMILRKFADYEGFYEIALPKIKGEKRVDVNINFYNIFDVLKNQLGYSLDSDGNKIPEWNKNFIVIADTESDPYCIDTTKANSPVYEAMHGTGKWDFSVHTNNFEVFLDKLIIYNYLNFRFNNKNYQYDLNSDAPSAEEKEIFQNIEKRQATVFNDFLNRLKESSALAEYIDLMKDEEIIDEVLELYNLNSPKDINENFIMSNIKIKNIWSSGNSLTFDFWLEKIDIQYVLTTNVDDSLFIGDIEIES